MNIEPNSTPQLGWVGVSLSNLKFPALFPAGGPGRTADLAVSGEFYVTNQPT